MSGTQEEDEAHLRRYFEGPQKKNDDPNLVEDLVYRMRHAKGGVVWHSWVDPNRPESPPVEWPEYPKDERPADVPEDGIMSHPVEPDVAAAAKEIRTSAKNPHIPIQSPEEGPCKPTNTPVENPDQIEDNFDLIHTPDFPGLYPGKAHSPWGGGNSYGYDSDDDYEY